MNPLVAPFGSRRTGYLGRKPGFRTSIGDPPDPPPDEEDLPPITHWAEQDGTGDGSSDTNAFTIADFLAQASAGDHCALLDGVYTGANNLIRPANGLSGGDDANRITISALNDGAVRLNGQGGNPPLRLVSGNNWWLFQGFDAHHTPFAGASQVVQLRSAQNIICRKIVAWDVDTTSSTNNAIWSVSTGEGFNPLCRDILLEDCAGFGDGWRVFNISQGGTLRVKLRRCWHRGDVFKGSQIGYQAYDHIAENCIGSWDYQGISATEQRAVLAVGRIDHFTDQNSNSKYLACIVSIHRPEDNAVSLQNMVDAFKNGNVTFQDLVLYTEGPNPVNRFANLQDMDELSFYQDITEVGEPLNDNIVYDAAQGGNWNEWNEGTQSFNAAANVQRYTSIANAIAGGANPFQQTPGTGARVYFRTVDEVLQDGSGGTTATSLWPWPMDSRIRAALSTAGEDPDEIFLGEGNGVTEMLEGLWGVTLP